MVWREVSEHGDCDWRCERMHIYPVVEGLTMLPGVLVALLYVAGIVHDWRIALYVSMGFWFRWGLIAFFGGFILVGMGIVGALAKLSPSLRILGWHLNRLWRVGATGR